MASAGDFSVVWNVVVSELFRPTFQNPWTFYLNSDPLTSLLVILTTVIIGTFIASLFTDNYSHVDRMWSLLPTFWVLHYVSFMFINSWTDSRMLLMLGCTIVWGGRLTYNFWRKGGYSLNGEDYRWAHLKAFLAPLGVWQLFNFGFICVFQHVLIFLFASPIDVAYRARGTPLNIWDFAATGLYLAFTAFETIADQQQWNFQIEKARLNASSEKKTGDFKLGFLTSGLFRYSRHPNFFSEMSLWWAFYLFSVAATGGAFFNWTISGAVLLTLLFQGSTTFTEKLAISKYPAYAKYQQTTSRLIPLWPGEAVEAGESDEVEHNAEETSTRPKRSSRTNASYAIQDMIEDEDEEHVAPVKPKRAPRALSPAPKTRGSDKTGALSPKATKKSAAAPLSPKRTKKTSATSPEPKLSPRQRRPNPSFISALSPPSSRKALDMSTSDSENPHQTRSRKPAAETQKSPRGRPRASRG